MLVHSCNVIFSCLFSVVIAGDGVLKVGTFQSYTKGSCCSPVFSIFGEAVSFSFYCFFSRSVILVLQGSTLIQHTCL